MTNRICKSPNFAISAIRLQSQQSDCNPPALQSDCVDCSSIVEIAAWHLVQGWGTICKLRNFCNLCNQTAISAIRLQSSYIVVWLWRLQSDCRDCALIADIAEIQQLTYTCPNPPHGFRHVASCFILIAEIALWLLRLQSNCGDRTLITEIEITIGVIYLQCRWIAVRLWRLHSNCWDCKKSAILLHL